MDLNEFKSLLSNSRSDIWSVIDTALTLASTAEYSAELKRRRDGIVERLYSSSQCRNCDLVVNGGEESPPLTPQSAHQDDPYDDDEQTKILRIKEQLEDPHQSDDAVVDLLQTLADMDLTFKGLKETDIGRHVNRLRKHQSSEVRSLVKHLVRKWKELVDEWVGSNNTNNDHQRASSLTDGDSPLLQNVPRKAKNGDQQGPDFGYSPNPHNWSVSPSADRINTELEYRPKSVVPKRETSSRPVMQSSPSMAPSASVPQTGKQLEV
ncbi:probable mediator of RNA polymerase II transcription subunit 26c, partial [Tanacetum coccineum]